jgi:hypothetical protein
MPEAPTTSPPTPPSCKNCGGREVQAMIVTALVIHWWCPKCGQIWGTPLDKPPTSEGGGP